MPFQLSGQEKTIGAITIEQGVFQGYTLFSPLTSRHAFLIDNEGHIINAWSTKFNPGAATYLAADGTLFRAGQLTQDVSIFGGGGGGGVIQQFDWDNQLLWEYFYNGEVIRQHHDFELLPNGNVLLVAWEVKTAEEAIAAGRDPDFLGDEFWPDHIIEVQPSGKRGGSIVWEWHAWDHMIQDFDPDKENFGVVENHPELIDINFGSAPRGDWNHLNSIDYNEDLDQIMVSSLGQNEIWIIDHSTTTEEAAAHNGGRYGRGGDLLFRWGNPQAYRGGTEDDKVFFNQHDARWIEEGSPDEGKIIVFVNGNDRPDGSYSSIDIISPVQDQSGNYLTDTNGSYLPEEVDFRYTYPEEENFHATFISGADQLDNGNLLICDGPKGKFFEVNPDQEVVWEYVNPLATEGLLKEGDEIKDNPVFKIEKYPVDFPGFADKDLTPGETIEESNIIITGVPPLAESKISIYPNPASNVLYIESVIGTDQNSLQIYSIQGSLVLKETFHQRAIVDISDLKAGIYFVRSDREVFKFIISR